MTPHQQLYLDKIEDAKTETARTVTEKQDAAQISAQNYIAAVNYLNDKISSYNNREEGSVVELMSAHEIAREALEDYKKVLAELDEKPKRR